MAKIKPKAILSRVLLGEPRQKEDGLHYLCTGLQRYLLLGLDSHEYIRRATDNLDDEDDRSSICSFSTTATADNLPGTGRAVDTYIYQPAGRWIERVAMRFTIASLHPARIASYLEADERYFDLVFDDSMNLYDAIARISRKQNGSTVIAGMKGLVKQTQSNSMNRSASALAALIRVSSFHFRKEIYANVSRIEPIFHLETLAGSLECSLPDKKWFLLLVKLARVTLIALGKPLVQKSFDPVLGKEVWQLWPSLESAQKLRQRLIRVLKVYRLSGVVPLDATIGEACAICAEAVSTCISWYARGDAYKHILEIVYLTVIFLLRSIHELTNSASITTNGHIYMVLQTIACWIDAIVYQCIYASGGHGFNMDLLEANISFRGLTLQVVNDDTKYMILPRSFGECYYSPVVDMRALPRRHRGEYTPQTQSLIEAAKRRSQHLLRSFEELEREVWGCASRTNVYTSQFEIHAIPHWLDIEDFGDDWWDHWKSTLERARNVQVPETPLTEEFRDARRIGLFDDDDDDDDDNDDNYGRDWSSYQLQHNSRHEWDQYLRSSMDWDWDLATCMNRLFRVEKQKRVAPSRTTSASSTAIDVAAGPPGGTLKISMGDAQEEDLPKEVQVAYTTKTGETRYMSYAPVGSGPGCQPASETASAGPRSGFRVFCGTNLGPGGRAAGLAT